jgi:hypothetical protein
VVSIKPNSGLATEFLTAGMGNICHGYYGYYGYFRQKFRTDSIKKRKKREIKEKQKTDKQ